MARYIKKGDIEPLVRIERPSSPSSQNTAHVVTACFTDVLSKRLLHTKEINNMVVSKKRGQDFQDECVESLKKVVDKYENRMEELKTLEKHILQAKAKVLTAEERSVGNLSRQLSESDPSHEHQPLNRFLNEALLSECKLLIPGQYLPRCSWPQGVPSSPVLGYMNPTVSSNMHATVPLYPEQMKPKMVVSKVKTQKGITSNAEYKKIKEILQKSCLANPRGSTSLWNTASSGPLKMLKQAQRSTQEGNESSLEHLPFVAEPTEVAFTKYQPGETYELRLLLRNVSVTSQQLCIIPPKTPYFSVSIDQLPNAEGLVAPGMHCSYKVKFFPLSLSDYHDELQAVMSSGLSLLVPLSGTRPAPELSLPSVLDCGYCFTGASKTITFECINNGGDGVFNFCKQLEETTATEGLDLQVGPFTISPRAFHLAPTDAVNITITFQPMAVGEQTQQLSLACDNGHVQSIQMRGIAEFVDVGCLCVTNSTTWDIESFKSKQEDLSTCINKDLPLSGKCLENPVVDFGNANPSQCIFKTAVIGNFSHVDVRFEWKFYRPNFESQSVSLFAKVPRSQNDLAVSSSVESKYSAFTVMPTSGLLKAREVKHFVICFLSNKEGNYEDVAHFGVSNVPELCLKGNVATKLSQGLISLISILLLGGIKPYLVSVIPAAITLPDVHIGVEIVKELKVSNQSLSDVDYTWITEKTSSICNIKLTPPAGSLAAGCLSSCNFSMTGLKEGLVNTTVLCSVRHSTIAVALPITIYVKPPEVFFDITSLNFGLIPFGGSVLLQLPIRSETNAFLQYELRQRASGKSDGEYMDCHCLSFSMKGGELQPYGRTSVAVECNPQTTGRLRSVVELLVQGKVMRSIEVQAEIQRPLVHLNKCLFHEVKAYENIQVVNQVDLVNESLIPTQFTWSCQTLGESSKFCHLLVSPLTGRIGPGESVPVSVLATWTQVGQHPEAIAICIVEGMEKPLFLCISAIVEGVSITYEGSKKGSLQLDFGSNNALGTKSLLFLEVSNTSAIPTHLSAHVVNFPPFFHELPCESGISDISRVAKSRCDVLLDQSLSVTNPRSKTDEHILSDYKVAILKGGQGACFVVEPLSIELSPFKTQRIAVSAYNDMWGEYLDELICEVNGLSQHKIPIHYGVVGCPIVFQATASNAKTIVRFGPHLPDVPPISRVLTLRNLSSVEIRVDWEMFNNIQDNKLIDLIWYNGNPFPKIIDEDLTQQITQDVPAFKVILKPHEGVKADGPICISPQQMIIPAHGSQVVQVTFCPTLTAMQNIGEDVISYALGYMSIDQKGGCAVKRLSGYDIAPLRIDITASIALPKLFLEGEREESLIFNYPASVFIQNKQLMKRFEKRHHLFLRNCGHSEINAQINCFSPHFEVSTSGSAKMSDYISLKPSGSIQVDVTFCITLEEFQNQCKGGEVLFCNQILVQCSNGFKQAFDMSVNISIPTLTLSSTSLDFGTVPLGLSNQIVISLSNSSPSEILWSLQIPAEFQSVLSVHSNSGVIPAFGVTTMEELHFEFKPRSECTYNFKVLLINELTAVISPVNILGIGSADGKFLMQTYERDSC